MTTGDLQVHRDPTPPLRTCFSGDLTRWTTSTRGVSGRVNNDQSLPPSRRHLIQRIPSESTTETDSGRDRRESLFPFRVRVLLRLVEETVNKTTQKIR